MADTLGDLTTALQTYVVSPLNAFGLGGFVFDVQGEGIANNSNDITDHYTEDNRATQDHIAVKPKRITLKGYVGELISEGPGTGSGTVQQITQKLTIVDAFLPLLSDAAIQAQAAIAGVDTGGLTSSTFSSLIPPAADIYSLVKNSIGLTGLTKKQQGAYQFFEACRTQGILMGVQTPWEFITNMAVETIVAIQSEDSIFQSDFAVTFKQMRFAATETVIALSGTGGIPSPGSPAGSSTWLQQIGAPVNLGAMPGAALPSPLLPGVQASIVSAQSFLNTGIANIFTFH